MQVYAGRVTNESWNQVLPGTDNAARPLMAVGVPRFRCCRLHRAGWFMLGSLCSEGPTRISPCGCCTQTMPCSEYALCCRWSRRSFLVSLCSPCFRHFLFQKCLGLWLPRHPRALLRFDETAPSMLVWQLSGVLSVPRFSPLCLHFRRCRRPP